jgi:RNA polymerase sigma-70 factor (ECF subfamily)
MRRNLFARPEVYLVEAVAKGAPEQDLSAVEKVLESEKDERLLIEAAQHDPGCFAELYEANFARVYAFIARRVQNRELAEDLTSEVFQQALANLGRFEWRGVPFAAWLFRIAANAIADRWKQSGREAPAEAAAEPAGLDGTERRAMLFKLVDSLPDDQRTVIVARFVEQKSTREIARELGRTEGAIKQLQFRALQTLRARAKSPRRTTGDV